MMATPERSKCAKVTTYVAETSPTTTKSDIVAQITPDISIEAEEILLPTCCLQYSIVITLLM
jgi:hypothetical protein